MTTTTKTKSKTKTNTKSEPVNKPTLVSFLLDRTGSMADCLTETITGFNTYLKELLKNDDGTMRFSLSQFDSQSIDIIHDAVPLKEVKELNKETFVPRFMTPLYDAMGQTIHATVKKAGTEYKVLFATLTDGQENASREYNLESIQHLIKRQEEESKWTFIYVGVGLGGFAATSKVAAGTIGASNVLKTSNKNTVKAYWMMARCSTDYAANARASGQSITCAFGDANPTTEDEGETQS